MSLSPSFEQLIQSLSKLPGVGRRSASRHALHLMQSRQDAENLLRSLSRALENLRPCSKCQNLCEDELCNICKDPKRQSEVVCVVERLADLQAFERSGAYRGAYFVLGGTLSPLDGIGPDQLQIPLLVSRCQNGEIQEVILATGSSAEGESTAHYLDHVLSKCGTKLSRLARGIPMGADLEYLDEHTLSRALEARTLL